MIDFHSYSNYRSYLSNIKYLKYASDVLAITAIIMSVIVLLVPTLVRMSTIPMSNICNWHNFGLVAFTALLIIIVSQSVRCLTNRQNSNEYECSHQQKVNESDDFLEPFNEIPCEIIQRIFSFLDPKELARCSLVSCRWHTNALDPLLWQAFDLKKISPQIKTFDENDWLFYANPDLGLDVSDIKPLNNLVVIPQLFRILSSQKIEKNAGITLLTVPKNLTIINLKKFAESPLNGRSTKFDFDKFNILNQLLEHGSKTQPNKQTYRAIVSNGLIEGTRGSFSFCNDIAEKMDELDFPDFLTFSTLIATSNIVNDSAARLFVDDADTLVLCKDRFPHLRGTFALLGSFNDLGFRGYALCKPFDMSVLGKIGFCIQLKLTEEYLLRR